MTPWVWKCKLGMWKKEGFLTFLLSLRSRGVVAVHAIAMSVTHRFWHHRFVQGCFSQRHKLTGHKSLHLFLFSFLLSFLFFFFCRFFFFFFGYPGRSTRLTSWSVLCDCTEPEMGRSGLWLCLQRLVGDIVCVDRCPFACMAVGRQTMHSIPWSVFEGSIPFAVKNRGIGEGI